MRRKAFEELPAAWGLPNTDEVALYRPGFWLERCLRPRRLHSKDIAPVVGPIQGRSVKRDDGANRRKGCGFDGDRRRRSSISASYSIGRWLVSAVRRATAPSTCRVRRGQGA